MDSRFTFLHDFFLMPHIRNVAIYTASQFLCLAPVCAKCHSADWVWTHCANSPLLWRGSPYLLLLSLCLWELAAAHWRSYMTVKRAINAGREAEVYGCLSAIVRPCLAHPLLRAGIPSLITGHPPRCRSNAAIKAV